MALTDARARRIAALVASLNQGRGRPDYTRRVAGNAWAKRLARAGGQYRLAAGPGPAIARERHSLAVLVHAGQIKATEADEFLGARYPGQRFAGGEFADLNQALLEAELVNQAATLRGGAALVRGIPAAQQAEGASTLKGVDAEAGGNAPIRVPRLPDTYKQEAVQDALEGLAESTEEALRAVRARPPSFPAGSLDGAALAPGSVQPEALNLLEVGRSLVSWPSADEAIELDLIPSTALDQYVAIGAERGPGRVWVATARPGRDSRLARGPARYRIVAPDMRFGVMSTRLPPDADVAANREPGILVQYGVVVTGIPHFLGRRPSRILAVEAVGDQPASLRTLFRTGGLAAAWPATGTDRDYFWSRTQAEHITASFPFAESFGADTTLSASVASLRDSTGFSFQLVTGRDGGEVFRQLCSRPTLGRELRGNGHGPSMTIPAGLPHESPSVPIAVDWQGSPATYIHRQEGYDFGTAGTRVVIGMPFSYSDCAALAPTDGSFSLVVMPLGEKLVSQSGLAAFAQPDQWAKNGMRLIESVTGRLRSWALDVIVD